MSGLRDRLARIALVLAMCAVLSWPAIWNGQPFIFYDTTTYVRSADMPIHMLSQGRISTEWTRSDDAEADASSSGEARRGNDPGEGFIMAGRSPYFGGLLYLSYVATDFWAFVAFCSLLSVFVIAMALKAIGRRSRSAMFGTVVLTAGLTTIAFYTSYLLADIFSGLGVLGLCLLATSHERFSRIERLGLVAVCALSCLFHPTHIILTATMIACIVALRWLGAVGRRGAVWGAGGGAFALLAGIGGTIVTSLAVQMAFGSPPRVAPLLTARFIEDGPGLAYIHEGCGGQRFIVCRFADRIVPDAVEFLWSSDRHGGIFLNADAGERVRLSQEDTPFALAVLKAYPLEQSRAIVANTVQQFLEFDSGWVNYDCDPGGVCVEGLPRRIDDEVRQSRGGRRLWPTQALTGLHYAAALAAVLFIAFAGLRRFARRETAEPLPPAVRAVWVWIALVLVALACNAFLGGALSEPQSRYQARIVWLLPFCAWLLLLSRRSGAPGG